MPPHESTAILVPRHRVDDLCVVAPAPEVKEKLMDQFQRLRSRAAELVGRNISLRAPNHVGLNDGLIYPGTYYPLGTTAEVARRAALERAPLRGVLRVVVVLVDFSDKAMPEGAADRFSQLLFSTGELQHGSVKEYYADVSGGLIDIQGQVIGPYRMPQPIAAYAGSDNGMQDSAPNARTMANDAVTLANPDVDFTPFDNDGNGYVDAFIVVHAGRGAEQTGSAADIWSHKWVLPSERAVDRTKIYAYLTIPEDAKLGVTAHELGHLIFGWPDLYDIDNTSEGIGNWCLMAAGSWGLGGDRPVHPSAWCKSTQGWINVMSQTNNADVTITDVKSSRTAYRLWRDGGGGNEYFLVENRQQAGFDESLPGQGLLIWHIDEAVSDNSNENHYKVALMQADGLRQLEANANRGDAGDPFPGSTGNSSFTGSSTPNSKSYAGSNTFVGVTGIPAASLAMQVHLSVRATLVPPKPFKELKDSVKELKELKERSKEAKEQFMEVKERKEIVEKGFFETKSVENRPLAPGLPGGVGTPTQADIESRLTAIEQTLQALFAALSGGSATSWPTAGEPFISDAERPQLGWAVGQPALSELRAQMESGSAQAKQAYDNLPPG